jgi:hypothetical protein
MPEPVTKTDLLATQQELRASIDKFQASLDRQARQLTIRFGVMWAVAIWFLVILLKRC